MNFYNSSQYLGGTMDWLSATVTVVGLFILRFGVPLVITMGVTYLLHRLDAKWHPQP